MKFLAGMFGHRRATPTVETPTPKPERLPPEAVARLARERAEAERAEERKRAGAEEIEQACKAFGFWWPADSYSIPESRLSGRSLYSRLGRAVGTLLGKLR